MSRHFSNLVKLHSEEGGWCFHLWFHSVVLVACQTSSNHQTNSAQMRYQFSNLCLQFHLLRICVFVAAWTVFLWTDSDWACVETQFLNHYFFIVWRLIFFKVKCHLNLFFSPSLIFRWVLRCIALLRLGLAGCMFTTVLFGGFDSYWNGPFNVISNLVR